MLENKDRPENLTQNVAQNSDGDQADAALAVLTRDSVRKGVHMLRILHGNGELTINQTSTLNKLKEGPQHMALMARLSGVSQPSMSQHASALEALGYIQRSRSPEDGRAVILTITDRGRDAVDRANKARNSSLHNLLSELSDEQKDQLSKGLEILKEISEIAIGSLSEDRK